MLDIQPGDFLCVTGQEYPVRSAASWTMPNAESFGFLGFATLTATTKRNPAMTSGKRGDPEVKLVNLHCTPLDPVDPDVRMRMGLDTPNELLQTCVADSYGFVMLILEDLKR